MSESLQKLRAEGGYSLVTEYVKKGGREGRKEQEARGDEEAGWHLSEALKKVKEEHEDRSPAGSLIYQFRGLRAEGNQPGKERDGGHVSGRAKRRNGGLGGCRVLNGRARAEGQVDDARQGWTSLVTGTCSRS